MPLEQKTGEHPLVATSPDSTNGRDGTTLLTIKTAFANATVSGNTLVVAAVSARKIRVLGYSLNNGGGAVIRVNFQSQTTPISSTKSLAAEGGGSNVYAYQGFCFETAVGEALNLNLSALGTVGADITYVEVS